MKITILGSGTFVPEINRHCSSYLVETGKEKIILDFGRGAIDSLLKLKIDLYDLDAIFISHMHSDHAGELAAFIQLILDTEGEKRIKKLKKIYTIYGPKGFKKDIKKLLEVFYVDKHKNIKRFQFEEISPNKIVRKGDLKIKGFKTQHGKGKANCLGYILQNKNRKFCYSGDSGFCKELVNACRDAGLAILEASRPSRWAINEKIKQHMSGEDAGLVAEKAKVKNLILTHIAGNYLSEIEKDLRKNYKGKFSIAKDLMSVVIN